MRSLPAAISSAVTATGAQPSLSITTQDLQLRYTQLASTGASAARNAAIITSAGTLLRASVSQHADPNTVTVYRIPNLTAASQWSAAGTNLASNANASGGVALVQTGATIRCFWMMNGFKCPQYADSTDDGVTWSAATQVIGAGPLTNNLMHGIAASSITDIIVAYADYAYAADGLYRAQYSGGSWGSWIGPIGPATPTWGGLRGIHLDASQATRIVIGGVQMRAQQSGIAAAAATWNGASTWGAWKSIHEMDTPSNGLSNSWPTVRYTAADSNYYACITLADDGSVSGTVATRTNIWRSKDGITWTLYGQAGTGFSFETQLMIINGATYVFDNASVWTAPAPAAALDLSADVLALHIHEATLRTNRISVVISNANGQYNSQPQLRDNASVSIALGYNGTTIPSHTAYIDAIRYEADAAVQTITLECRGPTKFLDQVCPRLIALSSNTVGQIATYLCVHAGVTLGALPGTQQFSQMIPCFMISPGETYWNALKRLANVFAFDSREAISPAVTLYERSGSDSSTHSYGQEALALSYQTNSDQANIIRVVGASTGGTNIFAEATDGLNIAATGAHRLRHIVDRMLDTPAKCRIKALLSLREEQTDSTQAGLTVTLNPQHEVGDVITITDSRLNLSGIAMRIQAITTTIDMRSGAWHQQLELNKP